jgi:D-alanyl-D-alanine carboxypeptidase
VLFRRICARGEIEGHSAMAIVGGNGRSRFIKTALAVLGLALGLISVTASPADARHRYGGYHRHYASHAHHYYRPHRYAYRARYVRRARGGGGGGYSPAFAAMIVDGNSGRTLYARNENELRHPASVTKVMTLYLLFEQLEKGKLRMDSEIEISSHAAAQAPSKLGLRPGSTIEVEDAIKAVVTKSANDIACAIAEKIGGDEDTFAEMMTRKAHALGMTRTNYANASGLPNDEQITTAHDLTILGRAIQERFPRYYRYFSTRAFHYGGSYMPNHNHLLGRIEGLDGIKTGYTRASGFNLLTSVHRDGHWIVGVVLGGTSGASRDRMMANLIEEHIDEGARSRTANTITEQPASDSRSETRPEFARPEPARPEPARPEPVRPEPVRAEPIKVEPPRAPKSEYEFVERFEPVQTISRPQSNVAAYAPTTSPMAALPALQERPRPAFIAGTVRASADDATAQRPRAALDGSTGRPTSASMGAGLTATPSSARWVVGPAAAKAKSEGRVDMARAEPARAPAPRPQAEEEPSFRSGRPQNAGWMIQIGATEDADKAQELLARAKSEGHAVLGRAHAFTEKVQKGHETLWRARFAGLEEDSAEAACRTLKRVGFSCFATRN